MFRLVAESAAVGDIMAGVGKGVSFVLWNDREGRSLLKKVWRSQQRGWLVVIGWLIAL